MSIEAANRILDEALDAGPRCGCSHVIAIDGPSGSGKTRLADAVSSAARARGLGAATVHTDEICPGWDGLLEVPHIVKRFLEQLALNAEATYPTWDWHANCPGPDAAVAPVDVLIIEGVGSGADRCASFLSARTRLDAPVDIRKKRALDRDGATFAPHWDTWAAAEVRYFAQEWSQDAPQTRLGN